MIFLLGAATGSTRLEKVYGKPDSAKSLHQSLVIANNYIAKRQYKSAITLLNDAVKQSPNEAALYVLRGCAHQFLQQSTDAERDIDRALQLSPNNVEGLTMKADLLAARGKQSESILIYDKVTRYAPDYAPAYIGEVIALRSQGKENEALSLCNQFLNRKQSYDILAQRAAALYSLGRPNQALADLNLVVKELPDNWWIHNLRCQSLLSLSRVADATAEAEVCTKLLPANGESLCLKAMCRLATGELDQCIALSTRAIELRFNRAYAIRGQARLKQQNWRLASQDLCIAVEQGATDQRSVEGLATSYAALGRKNEAEQVRAKFKAIFAQSDWEKLRSSAASEFAKGHYGRAIAFANEAASKCTTAQQQSSSFELLARIYEAVHKYESALSSIDKAIDISPDSAEASSTKADILGHLQRTEEALEICNHFLSGRGPSSSVLVSKARMLISSGAYSEAIEATSECLKNFPGTDQAYAQRALALYRLKQYDQCISDCDHICADNQFALTAYKLSSASRYAKGDVNGAIADLTAILETCKTNAAANVLATRAYLYIKLGNLKRAVEDLSKSIEKKPESTALLQRSIILTKQGHIEEALTDINRAIRLMPSVEGYELRRDLYRQNGQHSLASQDQKNIQKLQTRFSAI